MNSLNVIRRRWLIIASTVLAGTALAALIALLTPVTYTASSVTYLSVRDAGSLQDLSLGSNFVQSATSGYASVAESPYVLDQVAKALQMPGGGQELAKQVTATVQSDAPTIVIAATSASPSRAAQISNAVSRELTVAVQALLPQGEVATQGAPLSLTIISPASANSVERRPAIALVLALGAGLALAIGLFLAYVLDVLDSRVRDVSRLEASLTAPVLAMMPIEPHVRRTHTVSTDETASALSEAARTLSVNLKLSGGSSDPRTILVTSSVPAEGKTVTSIMLATAIAQSGARVLLIDFDLRRPAVASTLNLEGTLGVSGVIAGKLELGHAVQTVGKCGLHVLPAGTDVTSAGVMVQSAAAADLVSLAKQTYDYVVVDSPPLQAVADAALLAQLVDTVIVMAGYQRTRERVLRGTVHRLEQVGAPIAGIVVTLVPSRQIGDLYYADYTSEQATRGANAASEENNPRSLVGSQRLSSLPPASEL